MKSKSIGFALEAISSFMHKHCTYQTLVYYTSKPITLGTCIIESRKKNNVKTSGNKSN